MGCRPRQTLGPEGVPFRVTFAPGHIGVSDGVGGVVIIGADPSDQNKLVIQRIDANGVSSGRKVMFI